MSAPTWQDLYDLGLYTLQARRPKLVVREGDVTDAMVAGCATMADVVVGYAAGRFRSTYLDGAEGQDLTEEARDRGVARDAGSKSIGSITFTRPSTGSGGTIAAGFRVATTPASDGSFATFVTNTAAVFLSTDLTKTVTATCSAVGRGGNISPVSITRNLDVPFDATIIPSNPVRFAGGGDEQADPDLRDRTRSYYLTQRRGTTDALIYGAKQVPGVARVSIVTDPVSRQVTAYVSDADGNANSAMTTAVKTELFNWRAAGDVVDVIGATIYLQPVDVTITAKTGVSLDSLIDRIRSAIVARVALLAAGEVLYRDAVSAAAREVDRQNIVSVTVNNPSVSVAPAAGQIIRTSVDIVAVN
jgi:uncharacterized phage protein gp47/JayE